MEIKARAKINITLDVLSKREDGYHNVKMIMQTVDLYDTLHLEKTDSGITVSTNLPYLPTDKRNIAYKAAQLFFSTLNIDTAGIKINIHKRIPVAAGLAGGSTDAAAVLIGLNKIFKTELTTDELKVLGGRLGADVPYCILGGTALAEGIGDVITLLPPMPNTIIVLAKPPVSVSTAYVYGKLNVEGITIRPDTEAVINAIYNKDLMGITKGMYNVLEAVTTKEHRIINRIKNIMLGSGALNAMMSGSGPTVFGVFDHEVSARKAVNKLRTIVSDIFVVNTYNSNYGER
ncbi:4-(cytidine 5'-diphospho)-2-C-methyl-D-erythritol kinase [Petroclostridium sp. X23]|uniref:4-(cytidine 5'-diphospho)-2-C-methyl-D-erythritol kinase n=1 Tax=Petroclostridium sp. X23 TaxID=3045146 RepID=UPI0024AD6B39|nr:4-(cytidine 5'-diphospho)-2-C-methyl-D-erythritol kinase [Petroclostridium sp. X23]WHH61711.1 4-(cytidine 5'-diphospho)-2-C-methyl-D-erythritol kinase [Petroclostridium sp. X23]